MAGTGQPLRFLIAGAGAVGSGFGAMLRLAGHEVALLGKDRAHMDAVRERGLGMTGIWGERTAKGLRVLDSPEEASGPDYVLVTTKSYDTEAVLDDVAPCAPRARFVTLQNGLGNIEAVRARVGPERTMGGMVIIGFTIPAPGEVAVTVFGGEVLLGRPGPRGGASRGDGPPPDAEVARLVEAFDSAGIPTSATDNVLGAIWGKVLYNCALNALGAVLEVPYGELAAPSTWAIVGDAVGEAFAVARAEGVRLAWPDAGAYLEFLRSRQLPATAEHRSSMLQDLERGWLRRDLRGAHLMRGRTSGYGGRDTRDADLARGPTLANDGRDLRDANLTRGCRTEIDYLNGAVARLGAERGVATPVNSALSALVRFLAAQCQAPRRVTSAEEPYATRPRPGPADAERGAGGGDPARP